MPAQLSLLVFHMSGGIEWKYPAMERWAVSRRIMMRTGRRASACVQHSMKRISIAKIIILFFMFVPVVDVSLVFSQELKNRSEEWVRVGENHTGGVFYDKRSINRDDKGEVTVWDKHVFSSEMRNAIAESLPKIKDASYYVSLNRINCSKAEYDQLRIIYMSSEGKVIYDSDQEKDKYKQIGYRPIPPNTFIAGLAKAVCIDFP